MNNIIRENISIHPNVMDMLNQQIKEEQYASSSYLAMASWCDQNGYENASKYCYNQSSEESEHMMKIFKFIIDNGGAAYSPVVDGINHEFSSLKDVFLNALSMEIDVTKNIHSTMKKCRELNDYVSETLLLWLIQEQMEEEQKFRRIIEVIDMMDGSPAKLIDERIPTA